MRPIQNLDLTNLTAQGASQDSRGTGRVKCLRVSSPIGKVIDLSAGGARIRRRSHLYQSTKKPFRFKLESDVGNCTITARLNWQRRVGLFNCELGIEFIDVDPQARETLNAIARTCGRDATNLYHSLNRANAA